MQPHNCLDLLAVLAACTHNAVAINFIKGKGCGTIKKAIKVVDEVSEGEYAECVIVGDTAPHGNSQWHAVQSSKSHFVAATVRILFHH